MLFISTKKLFPSQDIEIIVLSPLCSPSATVDFIEVGAK